MSDETKIYMTDDQHKLLMAEIARHNAAMEFAAEANIALVRRSVEAQENPKPPISGRDWFAGQAIGAVIRQCAADLSWSTRGEEPEKYFAEKAYAVADAMLAARDDNTGQP